MKTSPTSFSLQALNEDASRFSGWARRLLICNPFYLASAVLLIVGIYNLWQDRIGLSESEHLWMNIITLQGYEALLILAMVLLARRQTWYDATLLSRIAAAFVFIPFVLLSQATWIGGSLPLRLAVLIAGLAVAKAVILRRGFRELLLPPRLLACGGVLLVVHVLLPLLFKHLHALSDNPEISATYLQTALIVLWSTVFPLLVAMANLLERPVRDDRICRLWWLPWWYLAIWLGSVGYHLWALMYVYDIAGSLTWTVPAMWVGFWTLYHRRTWLLGKTNWRAEAVLLLLPLVVLIGEGSTGLDWQLMLLSLANAVVYAVIGWRRASRQWVLYLSAVSLSAMVAFLPTHQIEMMQGFSRTETVIGAFCCFIVLLAAVKRSFIIGLIGGVCVVSTFMRLMPDTYVDIAWQLGTAFILIHSLRWRLPQAWIAEVLRGGVAIVWVVATLKWLHFDGTWVSVAGTVLPALLVMGCYLIYRLTTGDSTARVVVRASVGTLVLQPLYPVLDMAVEAGPTALMILLSFVLFGLGTALAWNRQAWLDEPSGREPEDEANPVVTAEVLP